MSTKPGRRLDLARGQPAAPDGDGPLTMVQLEVAVRDLPEAKQRQLRTTFRIHEQAARSWRKNFKEYLQLVKKALQSLPKYEGEPCHEMYALIEARAQVRINGQVFVEQEVLEELQQLFASGPDKRYKELVNGLTSGGMYASNSAAIVCKPTPMSELLQERVCDINSAIHAFKSVATALGLPEWCRLPEYVECPDDEEKPPASAYTAGRGPALGDGAH